MKKQKIFELIIITILSIFLVIFSNNIIHILNKFNSNNFSDSMNEVSDEYLYGEASGKKGDVKVKLKTDSSGKIKDLEVYDFSSKYYAVPSALQQLISATLDSYNANEVDTISGATDTTNTFKEAINDAIGYVEPSRQDNYTRVSLDDPEVLNLVTRKEVEQNTESLKTGFGAFITNSFSDADYNKNGNLVTHEYLCAVLIDSGRRIYDVKFDHIASNIAFDRLGKVPTSNVRSYRFSSDKSDSSFNGICTDGYYINIYDLENNVLKNKYLAENKKQFANKPGIDFFIKALESAMNNAVFVGANKNHSLGLSSIKELSKNNVIAPNNNENGTVAFETDYAVVTVDKEQIITSCVLDKADNIVTLTNEGKVLGSRDSQVYTVLELSNTNKYSKIAKNKVEEKNNLNKISDMFTNFNIETIISDVSKRTDDRGFGLDNTELADYKNVNFIKYIELLSDAYIDAKSILK